MGPRISDNKHIIQCYIDAIGKQQARDTFTDWLDSYQN